MTKKLSNNITFLRCTIIFLLCILVVLVLLAGRTDFEGNDFHKEEYVVKYQDTLWSIGKKCVGENIDVREWISAVKSLNDINSNIYPGQVIFVYVLNK